MKKIIFAILIVISFGVLIYINKDIVIKNKNYEINDIDKLMEEMTIDEKIAQMLVLYYNSDVADEELINTIKEINPGGFIIMKENITTFDKTRKFISDIKENSKIMPIISIDEEGGLVQRLQYISDIEINDIPTMSDLGNTDDETIACEIGKVIAEELKTIGINVDFAPVLDLNLNSENEIISTRSFGSDPILVSKMAVNLAKCMEENDVIPVYKHFPGHGDTSTDSHIDLPIINKSYEDLLSSDLIPFKNAIDNDAKIIMIGHLALPNIIGDNTPSTLSKSIVTDILKEDLGYNGLVITDALNMGALTDSYTDEEIYVNAINAGVDLLLMPNGSKNAIKYIKNNISEERINESVRNILEFKFKYLKDYELLDKSYLTSEEHKKIISKVNK